MSVYPSWTPIGDSTNRFTGIFNGNGHIISNLTIDNSGSDSQGLFGYTEESQIYDLGLLDVNVTGLNDVGGLVGNNNSGTISNSFYDAETTGYNEAAAGGASWTEEGAAASTADMQSESTFTDAGWDFADETANCTYDFWDLDGTVNGGYPWLTGLADSY